MVDPIDCSFFFESFFLLSLSRRMVDPIDYSFLAPLLHKNRGKVVSRHSVLLGALLQVRTPLSLLSHSLPSPFHSLSPLSPPLSFSALALSSLSSLPLSPFSLASHSLNLLCPPRRSASAAGGGGERRGAGDSRLLSLSPETYEPPPSCPVGYSLRAPACCGYLVASRGRSL